MTSIRHLIICLAGSIVLNLALVAESSAEGRFGASLSVREEYNDNILLTNVNRQSDFITTISPGLAVGYKTSAVDFSLDYGLNFKFYLQHDVYNETSINNAQKIRLDTTFQPGKFFLVKLFNE